MSAHCVCQNQLQASKDMIVALPVQNSSKDALVSKRFARSPFFVVINTADKTFEYVENPYVAAVKGVGKSVVDYLEQNYNVTALIAFELGLKVQKLAHKRSMQQIILHADGQSFTDILKLMKLA